MLYNEILVNTMDELFESWQEPLFLKKFWERFQEVTAQFRGLVFEKCHQYMEE